MAKMLVSNEARKEFSSLYRAFDEVNSILQTKFSQARERLRKEEQEMLEREAAEAERKLEEEEKPCEITAREAAEKEAALARLLEEKAMSLGAEPEKGPDVTQN